MQSFKFLVIFLYLLPIYQCECSCKELKIESDCLLEVNCLWLEQDQKCKQKECEDLEEEVELGQDWKINYCYWKNEECKVKPECEEIDFDEEIDSAICQQFGCNVFIDEIDQEKKEEREPPKKCRNQQCSEYDRQEELCNSQVIWNGVGYQYCYYEEPVCKPANSCPEIGNQVVCEKHCLEWRDNFCFMNYEYEDNPCSMLSTNKEHCQRIQKGELCSDFYDEINCLQYDKCKWVECSEEDSQEMCDYKCEDKECQDYECDEDKQAIMIQGFNDYIFCQKEGSKCTNTTQHDFGESCYQKTRKLYSWNGDECKKCKDWSAISNIMKLAMIPLILIYII